MKNLLVPIDFSEEANNAIDVAYEIAKINKAQITLLHVVDAPTFTPPINSVGEYNSPVLDNLYMIELINSAKERMNNILKEERFAELDIWDKVSLGNIFTTIEAEAEDRKIDLIVMGSKGSSGFDEFMIGSNTEKVVRRVKCPVLTVKKKQTQFSLKDIVFATNLSEDQGIVLSKLKKFQELFNSTIHLLKVNTPDNFEDTRASRKRMNDFIQKYQLENYSINTYNARTTEDGIILFAEEINANLIALGTHGRTGIAHLINGSIAEDIVNHAHRLVLTINMNR